MPLTDKKPMLYPEDWAFKETAHPKIQRIWRDTQPAGVSLCQVLLTRNRDYIQHNVCESLLSPIETPFHSLLISARTLLQGNTVFRSSCKLRGCLIFSKRSIIYKCLRRSGIRVELSTHRRNSYMNQNDVD